MADIMRILISTDIEGVAGVFHAEQTRAGNGEYERARRWMTREANAAVEGAFAGGATEVMVNDSHGGFRNLLPDELDPRARLVLGKPRYLGMAAGVEAGCDAMFMIGYHGKSQSAGILAHTINSFAFARVWLGGVEASEAALYGALAGERGVPVVMASGDDVFCEETQLIFPHARFVQTKAAWGQGSGMTLRRYSNWPTRCEKLVPTRRPRLPRWYIRCSRRRTNSRRSRSARRGRMPSPWPRRLPT